MLRNIGARARTFPEAVTMIEHWGVFDALTMMQQLGAVPQRPSG